MNGKKNPEKKTGSEELPGYPQYPAGEDILSTNSGMKRSSSDVEGLPGTNKLAPGSLNEELNQQQSPAHDPEGEVEKAPGPNDLTKDDLRALGDPNLSMDGGDDEQLMNRVHSLDATAGDLDIPGAELDDQNESLGSEDEENNFYSLGGDRHGS
jgi:hypothetical protein